MNDTNSPFPALRSDLGGRSAAKTRHRLFQRPSPGRKLLTITSGVLLLSVGMVQAEDKAAKPGAIMCATDGPALEVLAARELRRYWYLRTGDLLPIYVHGRHNRGAGFAADLEKYLEPALAGWRVVRLGPNELTVPHVERLVALVRAC